MVKKCYRHLVVPVYTFGLRSKKRVEKSLGPAKNKYFYPLIAKPAIHIAMVLLIFGFTTVHLQARTLPNSGGQGSLLFQAIGGDDLELIEETAAQTSLASTSSYLGQAYGVNPSFAYASDQIIPVAEQQALLVTGGSAISAISPSTGIADNGVERPRKIRTKTEVYIVKSGDTISTIASLFGLASSTILWANDLGARDYIRPGQELTILPTDGVQHTVKSGDTLSKLANNYDVSEAEIRAYNKLDEEDTITPGQELIVPGGRPPRMAPTPVRIVRTAPTIDEIQSVFTKPSPSQEEGSGMVWPTSGRVITQYWGWTHTGLDIDGHYDSPIYASDAGVVEVSGWGTGYGLQIVVNHENGFKTRYAHASKIFVNVGQRVEKGEVLAMVGTTGFSTGTHLHFEIYLNGVRQNPLLYVR